MSHRHDMSFSSPGYWGWRKFGPFWGLTTSTARMAIDVAEVLRPSGSDEVRKQARRENAAVCVEYADEFMTNTFGKDIAGGMPVEQLYRDALRFDPENAAAKRGLEAVAKAIEALKAQKEAEANKAKQEAKKNAAPEPGGL
jgi:hypothetical protein